MLFAVPTTWIVAGRGDIALANVTVNYDVTSDLPSGPEEPPGPRVRVHPAFLARAAQDSECFDALRRAGTGSEPGPGDPHLVGYGGGHSGNEWRFTATCRLNGEEETFSIDLGAELDPDQLELLEYGAVDELWVVRADGSRELVTDPPMVTYLDGRGGEPSAAVAQIEASSTRFWAVSDDGLVTSIDGVDWQPFTVDTENWQVLEVTANPGGDVALLLADAAGADRQTGLVMVSHDEGRTWSDIVPIVGAAARSALVTSVGPAGVAVSIDEPGAEREVFIDDKTGQVVFTARSPIGSDALAVGAETVLMPRERLAASGEALGPVLDVYDTSGELITTVFPD